jgi:hypothetical protein
MEERLTARFLQGESLFSFVFPFHFQHFFSSVLLPSFSIFPPIKIETKSAEKAIRYWILT